jgi:choline dehydrogenase-like flavoprotein
LKKIGFKVVISRKTPMYGVPHQCGTVRFGNDPRNSVLDVQCKTHDLDNLYVVDSGFFPSSTSGYPGLTIAANGFRVADYIKSRM